MAQDAAPPPDVVPYPNHTVWAVSGGGGGFDHASAIAIDPAGNTYIAGETVGGTFGPHTVGSFGSYDILAARLDAGGRFTWVTTAQGADEDNGAAVAVAPNGDVRMTGYVTADVSMGNLSATNHCNEDVLVARLSGSGQPLWLLAFGGPDWDSGVSVAVDAQGNRFVVGHFSGSMSVGSTMLTSHGNLDAFVVKLDPSGKPLWALAAGGFSWDTGLSVATLPDGGALVSGHFREMATFGQHSLTSAGEPDLFVMRLSADGKVQWATRGGGPGHDTGRAVAAGPDGSSYVTGNFRGQAFCGPYEVTSRGGPDIFVARLDPQGSFLWARSAGGPGDDGGYALAVDNDGVVVVGGFVETAHFGGTTLTSRGDADAFVARYRSDGSLDWVVQAGGPDGDVPAGVAVHPDGTLGIAGYFRDHAYFGQTRLDAVGLTDVFVWRMRPPK